MRIMTAIATSQPPVAPTQPAAADHGGSTSRSIVPTAIQAVAAVMAMANTRAAAIPPGVLRTETQVDNAVAHQRTINRIGCEVRNRASVVAAPKRMRVTAD